jgi:hypothetical protein
MDTWKINVQTDAGDISGLNQLKNEASTKEISVTTNAGDISFEVE